jgi:hypothetical protein
MSICADMQICPQAPPHLQPATTPLLQGCRSSPSVATPLLVDPAGVFFKLLYRGGARWWLVLGRREAVADRRCVCQPVRMNGAVCAVKTADPIFFIFAVGNGRRL